MLDILRNSYGEGFFMGGEAAEVVGYYHLLPGLVLDGKVILLYAKYHALEARKNSMYGLVSDHLQGCTVMLDDDMPAIEVFAELLEAKAH